MKENNNYSLLVDELKEAEINDNLSFHHSRLNYLIAENMDEYIILKQIRKQFGLSCFEKYDEPYGSKGRMLVYSCIDAHDGIVHGMTGKNYELWESLKSRYCREKKKIKQEKYFREHGEQLTLF